jgi:hypothetical protein
MTVLTNTIWNPGAEHATLSVENDSGSTVARTNVAEGEMPKRGSYFYTLTSTGTGVARCRTLDEHRGDAVAGERWWVGVLVRAKASNAAPRDVRVGIRFYNAAPGGTTGSAVGADVFSATETLSPGEEAELWVTGVGGVGTLSVTALLERVATGATGDVIQFDSLNVTQYDDDTVPPPFIAGDMGAAYAWTGTESLSPSEYYIPEHELEVSIDMDPSPRVQVTMTDLYPTTDTVTLFREFDGVTYSVREALGILALGAFTVLDLEPPFGVPITYRAMQYDDAGNELGYTPTTAVVSVEPVLGDGGVDWGVVSDPLRPSAAVVVQFTAAAAQRPQAPIDYQLHRVRQADSVKVVALVTPRGLLQGLNMDFWTDDEATAETVKDLLTEARGLILIRTYAPMPVPRLLYCLSPNPVPDDIDLAGGVEAIEWYNTVEEVTATAGGYGAALFPWSLYVAAFPTWADMKAAYTTWLDAKQNPPAGDD